MTEFKIEPVGHTTVELITGTTIKKAQADAEGSRYIFTKVPKSPYLLCEDPEKSVVYAVHVHNGVLSCTCDHFRKHGDKCEHLYRAMELAQETLEPADLAMVPILEAAGWTDQDGVFSPPAVKAKGKPQVVDELPPVDPPADKPKGKVPKKLAERKCKHCELVIKASTQSVADKRCAVHEKVCKENPANKPDEPEAPPADKPPADPPDIPKEKPKKVATPDPPKKVATPDPPKKVATPDPPKGEHKTEGTPSEIYTGGYNEFICVPPEIARAFCEMQKTELFATNDAANAFYNTKYADLASIWRVVRPALTKVGLSITQPTEPYPAGITVVTIVMHTSGVAFQSRLSAPFPRNRDKMGKEKPWTVQELGSLISYLRRYALAGVLGISTTDDDGEAASGRKG